MLRHLKNLFTRGKKKRKKYTRRYSGRNALKDSSAAVMLALGDGQARTHREIHSSIVESKLLTHTPSQAAINHVLIKMKEAKLINEVGARIYQKKEA